jgi:hypothetical protein
MKRPVTPPQEFARGTGHQAEFSLTQHRVKFWLIRSASWRRVRSDSRVKTDVRTDKAALIGPGSFCAPAAEK